MNKVFMMYMVGISGSGKTTIASLLEEELKKINVNNIQIIDGDIIRKQFGNIFGYTFEERMKCNQAVRVVVEYLIKNNISVILTQVGAYEVMRENMRKQFEGNYIEVYVKCSFEECVRRDVKNYYKKHLDGTMKNLNGADDVFEIPEKSHIIIDTEKESVKSGVEKIVKYLQEQGYGI